jgi:hypothetical protein
MKKEVAALMRNTMATNKKDSAFVGEERINNIYSYHPPKNGQQDIYTALQTGGAKLHLLIESMCPPSRERSLALTKLEEVIMWAKKSVAVNKTVWEEINGKEDN